MGAKNARRSVHEADCRCLLENHLIMSRYNVWSNRARSFNVMRKKHAGDYPRERRARDSHDER